MFFICLGSALLPAGKKGSSEQIHESDLKPGRDWNIASLRGLVKLKMAEALTHCSANELVVCLPDTKQPLSQDKAFNSWDPIPPNPSGPQPLIVVAPAPPQQPQQQADGEESFRFGPLVSF